VTATQRLDVRVLGDYFFTIGAPVLDVEAVPGSASTPGLRAASILWAGFNPGHRTLIARATLDAAASAASLPLRIEFAPGRVKLVNTTGVTAGSYTADALVPPLARYLAQLERQVARGQTPTSGGAYVTSKPIATALRIVVPLRVTGTVGRRKVNAVVEGDSLIVERDTCSAGAAAQRPDGRTIGTAPPRTRIARLPDARPHAPVPVVSRQPRPLGLKRNHVHLPHRCEAGATACGHRARHAARLDDDDRHCGRAAPRCGGWGVRLV
jgi:hypothetical protein